MKRMIHIQFSIHLKKAVVLEHVLVPVLEMLFSFGNYAIQKNVY